MLAPRRRRPHAPRRTGEERRGGSWRLRRSLKTAGPGHFSLVSHLFRLIL